MEGLPRRSCASDASYIWSAEAAAALAGVGRALSPGTARGLHLRAARLQPGAELGEPLLALAGELLQLHQLLLDVVEVGGQVAPDLRHRASRAR